jgi:hypothetical protein
MKRLMAATGLAFLVASCDDRIPVSPSQTPPSTGPIIFQQAPAVVPPAVVPPTGVPTGPSTPGPVGPSGTVLVPGQSIEGTVGDKDPVCFPNWDSSGHCRQFDITVRGDGILRALVEWTGPTRGVGNSEVFLVPPDGSWTYAADEWPEKRVSLSVHEGLTYHVVLISYGPFPDFFKLNTDLR